MKIVRPNVKKNLKKLKKQLLECVPHSNFAVNNKKKIPCSFLEIPILSKPLIYFTTYQVAFKSSSVTGNNGLEKMRKNINHRCYRNLISNISN